MEYKEFSTLYQSQLSIGELLNKLSLYQYPGDDFISQLQKEVDRIFSILKHSYFEDCYWLEHPLSTKDAFAIYSAKFKK